MDFEVYLKILQDWDMIVPNNRMELNCADIISEVEKFNIELGIALGFLPQIDTQIYDSAHFAAISLIEQFTQDRYAVIRFSRFGRLVTIISLKSLDRHTLRLVLEEFRKYNYIYIPADVLEERYTGILDGFNTWMKRFFHYY